MSMKKITQATKQKVKSKLILSIAFLALTAVSFATPVKTSHGGDDDITNSTAFASHKTIYENGAVKTILWYDAAGNVKATIRYYNEESLNPFILSRVKAEFSGKTIFGVTEISSDQGIIYKIILMDDKKWYHISSDSEGDLTLENKYKKA